MPEKINNLKLEPLTEYELDFIRWRIWEALRRNQYYINEFAKLKVTHFLDPDLEDLFCKKWKLPYHVDPGTEFKDLTNPQWLFWELYKPIYDHAACVDPWYWIVEDKYLRVWIDLESSRNQIEAAMKKNLDKWRSKGVYFYGRKIKRKVEGQAVKEVGLSGNYLGIHINLEAPRNTKKKVSNGYIELEIKEILFKWLDDWKGNKKIIYRLSGVWESCFKVYDRLKILLAKKEIAIESLKNPCTICLERDTCQKLCPEAESYVNQDYVHRGGVARIYSNNEREHIDPEEIKEYKEYRGQQ